MIICPNAHLDDKTILQQTSKNIRNIEMCCNLYEIICLHKTLLQKHVFVFQRPFILLKALSDKLGFLSFYTNILLR